jgi:hypothetical protein
MSMSFRPKLRVDITNQERGADEMRLPLLLATLFLLSACSNTDSDAARVFDNAFSTQPPTGVTVLHGYRVERRRFFATEEMWRLHLAGPGADKLVRQQWPDLRLGMPRVFLQGIQTPWFAPGKDLKQYRTYMSQSNPAVTVMESETTDEVFVAYDGL